MALDPDWVGWATAVIIATRTHPQDPWIIVSSPPLTVSSHLLLIE